MLRQRSEFFALIYDLITRYRCILNAGEPVNVSEVEYNLAAIRQPVWGYVVQKCPTFVNRNCDASFTEIFENTIFDSVFEEEKNLFQTCYTLIGNCKNCNKRLANNGKMILNYISEEDVRSLTGNILNDWEIYYTIFNNNIIKHYRVHVVLYQMF